MEYWQVQNFSENLFLSCLLIKIVPLKLWSFTYESIKLSMDADWPNELIVIPISIKREIRLFNF